MPFSLLRRFSYSVYNEPKIVRRQPLGLLLTWAALSLNIWFKGLDAEHSGHWFSFSRTFLHAAIFVPLLER